MVRIGAFRKTSLVDWQGKIVSTIFTIGCNFRCFWCHNKDLVFAKVKEIPEDDILKKLEENRWIDGVCITGGEPTIQEGLDKFLSRIVSIGLPVKLDTNGTNPQILEILIKKGLVEYIAMDIKAPFEKYSLLVGISDPPIKRIKESISLIMSSGIEYEFRTTVIPGYLTPRDIEKIAMTIKGAKRYILQEYIPVREYPKKGNREMIETAAARARTHVREVLVLNH